MNVREPEITSVTDPTDKELTQLWKTIDWKRVKEVVNNLQSRIASAAKNENWSATRSYEIHRSKMLSYPFGIILLSNCHKIDYADFSYSYFSIDGYDLENQGIH